MRLNIVQIQGGKRRIDWPVFLLFTMATYATFIGAAELFWKLFSGDLSPLMGWVAMYFATMIVLRTLFNAFVLPVHVEENWVRKGRA